MESKPILPRAGHLSIREIQSLVARARVSLLNISMILNVNSATEEFKADNWAGVRATCQEADDSLQDVQNTLGRIEQKENE